MNVFQKASKRILTRLDLYKYVEYRNGKKNRMDIPESSGKRLFFMMMPTYGNVGDQAICYATQKYIEDNFSDYTVVKIVLQSTYKAVAVIEDVIKPGDIVMLQGGGNFGNLYRDIEAARRFIVSHLKNNRIISLPCTICFNEAKGGKKDLRKAEKIYNSHKDLTLISRDEKSYEFAKEHFGSCRNILFPDMAFYLWEDKKADLTQRKGVTACLRFDPERSASVDRTAIIKKIEEKYEDYLIVDTQLSRSVWGSLRKEEIHSIVKSLAFGRVVVTDRLHGMLLSVISGTPCVVLPAGDNKTQGTYNWIKDLGSVVFCESADVAEILEHVDRLSELKEAGFIDMKEKYFLGLRDKILS